MSYRYTTAIDMKKKKEQKEIDKVILKMIQMAAESGLPLKVKHKDIEFNLPLRDN